ncbi:MAG: GC-type dockerin domain-anchored protein [Phycisphaerales bacterium]
MPRSPVPSIFLILALSGAAIGLTTMPIQAASAVAVACDPPIPAPGETLVWDASLSPIQICQDTTIPAGATVELAPGTRLVVSSGVTLSVQGELRALGTEASPITIEGGGQALVAGLMDMEHATVTLDVNAASGARAAIRLAHGVVPDGSDLSQPVRDAVVALEDVVVERGFVNAFGQLAFHGVEFRDPGPFTSVGAYLLARDVVMHGRNLEVVVDYQPRLLSNVDVLDPFQGAAIIATAGGVGPGSNLLIDADCQLVGAEYPVRLRTGGLHPDSVLPLTGNDRNAIAIGGAGAGSGVCDWPDLGLPYHVEDDARVQGRVRPAPGTVFKLGLFDSLQIFGNFFDDSTIFRGTPETPVYLERLHPDDEPGGLALFTSTAEYLDVTGMRITSTSGFNFIRESTIRQSLVGIFGDASATVEIRGCQIYDNDVGVEDDASSSPAIDMAGGVPGAGGRPNILEGNTIAAQNNASPSGRSGDFPAQLNWWGDTSGPFSPFINPDGRGDEIGFAVEAEPWLTQRPDLTDTPPYVDIHYPFILAEPGDTLLLRWDARDDGSITDQRILLDISGGGAFEYVVLKDGLDGDQRSAFITIPDIGLTGDARSSLLRVEAADDAGNVGTHDITLQVPTQNRPDGLVTFRPSPAEGFVPREERNICYDATGIAAGNITFFLVLDTEANSLQRGPSGRAGIGECSISSLRFPAVSTNRARFLLFSDGVGNDNDWYFSHPFEVRPSAHFPDRPPTASMLTPVQGDRFSGGSVVPMTWTASDDESLREFRIQVSLNDGRTWSTFDTIAGDRRAYDLRLPPLDATLENVRVRIVAVDERFQATASGDDRTIAFEPGAGCRVDLDGDGRATLFDFLAFQNAFDAGDPVADFDGDGELTLFDFLAFQNAFDLGC